MIRWVAMFLLSAAPALADPCSSFNSFQFSPNELERCVRDLRANQQIMEVEIQNAERLTCVLAGSLAASKVERDPELEDFMKRFCPLPKKKR